jgi:hypothetical protein
MTIQLKVKSGLSAPVIGSIPHEWDAQWFRRFVTNYLQNADVRNTPGIVGASFANPPTSTIIASAVAVFSATTAGTVPASGGGGVNVLYANGTWAPPVTGSAFANPTASVGLTAVNGTAVTAMRSDAAPALSQTISPTMTGNWTFTPASGTPITLVPPSGIVGLIMNGTDIAQLRLNASAIANRAMLQLAVAGTNWGKIGLDGTNNIFSDSTNGDLCISAIQTGTLRFGAGGASASQWQLNGNGGITSSGVTGGSKGAGTINAVGLYVAGVALTNASSANPSAQVGPTAVNGVATTFMTSDSAPAINAGAAYTWGGIHTFNARIAAAAGLTVSGNTFISRGITDNATATALTVAATGAISVATPSSGNVALTVNGATAAIGMVLISGLSGTTSGADQNIRRAGSTANQIQQGASLDLSDSTATTASSIQHSGGQFELWMTQNNGVTWSQALKVLTNNNTQFINAVGVNNVTPPAQVTGWGTPTGNAVVANFPGGGPATLAQCSQAIAQIIHDLKAFGLYGA